MLCSDFDPDRKAVINQRTTFPPSRFPPDVHGRVLPAIVESLLQRFGGEEILALRFCSGPVPVYRVRALGQEFALFVPHVGGAASGSMMEELAAHGGRCFVFFGSCGVLRGEITDGHLILPLPPSGTKGSPTTICRLRTRWPWTPPVWPPAGRP